jgi:hypothetical protein
MKPDLNTESRTGSVSSRGCGRPGVIRAMDTGTVEANAQSMMQVMLRSPSTKILLVLRSGWQRGKPSTGLANASNAGYHSLQEMAYGGIVQPVFATVNLSTNLNKIFPSTNCRTSALDVSKSLRIGIGVKKTLCCSLSS